MGDNYAMCVEWTKPSGVENRSLSMRLLHAAETIRLRLCTNFVRDDRTLENECSCHSKLFQKLRSHHHFRCRPEILRDRDDDPVVRTAGVAKHSRPKVCPIRAMHQNMLGCLMTPSAGASGAIRTRNVPRVQVGI